MTLSELITAPLRKSEAATSKKPHNLNASASLLETLYISCVRTDGGTQPRAGLNSEVIEDYVQAMAGGAEFPPVIVFYDGTNYWLADGFHRVEATKKAGLAAIAADVRQGNRRDAVLFSVGANAKHGLRRSNADKRRAVLTLLSDSEWAQWSNSEIAKQCGVVEWLVRKLKEELSSCNTKIDQEYAKKCGVNEDTLIEAQQRLESLPQERTAQRLGKTYSVNTTNIGRNSKKATSTHEPTPCKIPEQHHPAKYNTDLTTPPTDPTRNVSLSGGVSPRQHARLSDEVLGKRRPATLFSKTKPVDVFLGVPLVQPKEQQPKAQIIDISAEEVEDKDATVVDQAALQLLKEEDVEPEIPPLFTASSSIGFSFFAYTSNPDKIGQLSNKTLLTPADNSENGCPVFSKDDDRNKIQTVNADLSTQHLAIGGEGQPSAKDLSIQTENTNTRLPLSSKPYLSPKDFFNTRSGFYLSHNSKSNGLQDEVQLVSRSSLLSQQLQQNDVALRLTRTGNQLLPVAWSNQVILTDMDKIPFGFPPQPTPLKISEICLSFVANVEFFSEAEVLSALKAIHTRIPPTRLVLHTRTDTELKHIIKDAQLELNQRQYLESSKGENDPHVSQEL